LGALIASIFRAGSRNKSLLLFKNSKEQLRSHDVVIAKRNNYIYMYRQDPRYAVKSMHPSLRLLALN
jgi:hypothetical protein